MADHFASGSWQVTSGKEEEFVERWTRFLRWTRETQPALVGASLIRHEQNPSLFVSFAEWEDATARDAWKQDPGFMQHFRACRELCDEFHGGDYDRLVAI